jgi:hypothetical protein
MKAAPLFNQAQLVASMKRQGFDPDQGAVLVLPHFQRERMAVIPHFVRFSHVVVAPLPMNGLQHAA